MLIDRNFFENKKNDLEIYKDSIDRYKKNLLLIIQEKGMSVSEFVKLEESFSELPDHIFFKYNLKSLSYQSEENMNVYNEIVKYNKEQLSDLNYNKDYYAFIKSLKTEDEQDEIYKNKS